MNAFRPFSPFALRVRGSVYTPASVAGLKLWLHADALSGSDGSAVLSWADSSSNAHALTQATGANQPTLKLNVINGKPVVRFDGVHSYMQSGSFTLAQPYTVIAVVNMVTTGASGTNDTIFDAITAGQASGLIDEGSLQQPYTVMNAGTALTNNWLQRDPSILVMTFNGNSSTIRRNGITVETGAAGAGALNGFTLGARGDGTRPANVDVAELLIVSSLANGDLANVESYLAGKYGIALPSSGQSEQRILFDGDSTCVGYSSNNALLATTNWPGQVVAGLGQPWTGRNFGYAGESVSGMVTYHNSTCLPYYNASLPWNIGVLLGGFNDCYWTGSGNNAANSIWTWHDKMQRAGFRTVACTVASQGSGGTPAQIAAMNTRLRAEWASHADVLVDLQADSRLNNSSNSTYFLGDGIHFTPAGYAVIGSLVTTALRSFLASPPARISPPSSGTTLLADSFAGTSGTVLSAHLLNDGKSNWVSSGGTEATLNGSGGVHSSSDIAYLTNASWQDHTLQFSFALDSTTGSCWAMPLVRGFANADSFYIYLQGDGSFALYEFLRGGYTYRGGSSWTADTATHTVKVVCSGSTITAYLDGTQKLTYTGTSPLANGPMVGFRVNGATVSALTATKT